MKSFDQNHASFTVGDKKSRFKLLKRSLAEHMNSAVVRASVLPKMTTS
ncbi:hypothetical protein ABIE45_006189 [Methylobacterium sp. OAE515]